MAEWVLRWIGGGGAPVVVTRWCHRRQFAVRFERRAGAAVGGQIVNVEGDDDVVVAMAGALASEWLFAWVVWSMQ